MGRSLRCCSQDGCSASRVMGEFREVLGVVHDETFGEHTVRKVTQFATMMAFNTKIEPQTMTVICNVKVNEAVCLVFWCLRTLVVATVNICRQVFTGLYILLYISPIYEQH